MSVLLQFLSPTNLPVDLRGIVPGPDSRKALQHRRVWVGNEQVPLADLFRLSGDPGDGVWDFEGDLTAVHNIGRGMESGTIRIHASAGRYLGAELRGGSIEVEGNTGDWMGSEMLGGLIRVHGHAGNFAGSAQTGSKSGMRGGRIEILGNAGREVAQRMRRGWITIKGDCGPYAAHAMWAGTLLILGKCESYPGLAMRRGTIAILGSTETPLAPTFRHACRLRPAALGLMLKMLPSELFPGVRDSVGEIDLHQGDISEGGRGEIWTAT